MAVYSLPFDSVVRAKRFKKRMAKPWMAKVSKDRDGEYVFDYPDYDLAAGDDLEDIFFARAKRTKKDFDIRLYVKSMVRSYVQGEDPTGQGDPIEAINIVREAIGLKSINLKKTNAASEPILYLKSQKLNIATYETYTLSKQKQGFVRFYKLQKFARTKGAMVYVIRFKSVRNIAKVKPLLSARYDVLAFRKISPYSDYGYILAVKPKK